MVQKINALTLLAAALLFSSCSGDFQGILGIADGTIAWSRRDWSRASASFLKVAESGPEKFSSWASYGLASTWLAQEEYDAAMSRLSLIDSSSDPDLAAGVWYQAGIAAWRKGLESEAAAFFRKSLEFDSSALDAKINLELIASKRESERKVQSGSAPGVNRSDSEAAAQDALFEYIRKKEEDAWKHAPENQLRNSVQDY
ncbi:MAG TPA: hypothetical protein PL077_04220 [Treponemataceae bacterium]|nr:hypothetical protein [Treponemataceae bacterium]